MADVFNQGGGGGRVTLTEENAEFALSKPYDLSWPPSPEAWQQLNEMLDLLFRNMSKVSAGDISSIVSLTTIIEQLQSDVDDLGSSTTATGLVVVQKTLTDAQIKSLNTVPVAVITAAMIGTDNICIPVLWSVDTRKPTATGYSGNPTWSLRPQGIVLDLVNGVTPSLTSANEHYTAGTQSGFLHNKTTGGTLKNIQTMVRSSADVTGGDALNTAIVTVGYVLISGV